MYYPKIDDTGNSRNLISTWLGYNHNYNIGQGEFFDMENMSTDQYPLASVRKVRSLLEDYSGLNEAVYTIRGTIFANNILWALVGTHLVDLTNNHRYQYSSLMDEEEDHTSPQQMVMMGSYLVIFPLKIYINIVNDTTDCGKLESSYSVESGKTITYTPSTYEGDTLQNLVTQADAPSGAVHGDYWICTDPAKSGLYFYNGYQSSWEAVATSYIKISIPGVDLTDYFSEGDAVFMNTKIKEINEGSIIQTIGDGYLIVIGLMNKVTDSESTSSAWTLTLKRKVPTMDYVCMDKNRIWGCHYGYDNISHKTVNEIYACKLGDFKNWYVYQGLSTDSYALTVGEMGQFTGCISFQGYPHFFKEDMMYKIYGDYPAEYQMVQQHAPGVQYGSGKSLVVVGNYLLYKSVRDICIFDGSTPVAISQPLSRTDMYYDAVAGGCKDKYYIEMQTDMGGHRMFVYDIQTGLWMKETAGEFIAFTNSVDGQLYAVTTKSVHGLGDTNNAIYLREDRLDEEWVDWFAETGEMGYEYIDKKYVSRITLRAYIPVRSEITIEISYDDRPYDEVATLRGIDDVTSQSYAFAPFRCDHFKIKISGHGDCRIYSMAISTEYGSEE